jgi:hypothetical protein
LQSRKAVSIIKEHQVIVLIFTGRDFSLGVTERAKLELCFYIRRRLEPTPSVGWRRRREPTPSAGWRRKLEPAPSGGGGGATTTIPSLRGAMRRSNPAIVRQVAMLLFLPRSAQSLRADYRKTGTKKNPGTHARGFSVMNNE